jgi:hypothetical protein
MCDSPRLLLERKNRSKNPRPRFAHRTWGTLHRYSGRGGSSDFDAAEIHASDAEDAGLAFEDAEELCGVGHPVVA